MELEKLGGLEKCSRLEEFATISPGLEELEELARVGRFAEFEELLALVEVEDFPELEEVSAWTIPSVRNSSSSILSDRGEASP